MANDALEVLTIGHSSHEIARFIELLRGHGVTAVADVRSSPASRFNPQFNRKPLAGALKAAGIAYVFLGDELGARPRDPSVYERGSVVYGKLARTAKFRVGLERVKDGARKHRLALMCAERDPLHCHRALLVGRALELDGVAVSHILADGTAETSAAAMRRLLADDPSEGADMFDSQDRLIELAVERRAREAAYQDEKLAAGTAEAD